MADLFISYGREDRREAKALVVWLERRGWSVWWDRELLGGESFDDVIEENLEAASCVLVLWSQKSVRSNWVKAEASAGLERGRLVPVRLDDSPLPLEFRRIQTIDLRFPKPSTASIQNLLDAISRVLGEPTAPLPINPPARRRASRSSSARPRNRLGWVATGAFALTLALTWALTRPDAPPVTAKPETAKHSQPDAARDEGPQLKSPVVPKESVAHVASDQAAAKPVVDPPLSTAAAQLEAQRVEARRVFDERSAALSERVGSASLQILVGELLSEHAAIQPDSLGREPADRYIQLGKLLWDRGLELLSDASRSVDAAVADLQLVLESQREAASDSQQEWFDEWTVHACATIASTHFTSELEPEQRTAALSSLAPFSLEDATGALTELVAIAVDSFDWDASTESEAEARLLERQPLFIFADDEDSLVGAAVSARRANLLRILAEAEEARIDAWQAARAEILGGGDLAAAEAYYTELGANAEHASTNAYLAKLGLLDCEVSRALRGIDARDQELDKAKREDILFALEKDLAQLRFPPDLRAPDETSAAAYVLYRRARVHSELCNIWAQLLAHRPSSITYQNGWKRHAQTGLVETRAELAADFPDEQNEKGERYVDLAKGLPDHRSLLP